MQTFGALDALPLWGFFLAVMLLILLSVEGGYRLGRFRRSRSDLEKESPVGAMVGASLGLLAFMLAFTFGIAAGRFDARRQILLDEVNAIGTTFLRAAMLPERGEEIRNLLREYVDVRLEAVQSQKIAEGIRRSEQIQDQLWTNATALAQQNPTSIVVGLFVQSLNEVIDIHATRVHFGIRNRIPGAIWSALFLVAALSLAAMGYHAGLAGTTRSLAQIAVAFTFAVVILLIADLDRPHAGLLTVSQQGLTDLQQSMKVARP
jgi:hypothetical protein